MTEIEAKVKYVKLARSLRTYGVSFFLVKVRCQRVVAAASSSKGSSEGKTMPLYQREKQIFELAEMKLCDLKKKKKKKVNSNAIIRKYADVKGCI